MTPQVMVAPPADGAADRKSLAPRVSDGAGTHVVIPGLGQQLYQQSLASSKQVPGRGGYRRMDGLDGKLRALVGDTGSGGDVGLTSPYVLTTLLCF